MLKAFPCYKIIAEGVNGAETTVTLPFTSQISIRREIQNMPAEADLTIFNLNKDNRENLYFDRYNFAGYRKLEVYMGYGGNYSLCFKGNIMECYSVRSGVNFETHINAWDGGMYYTSSVSSENCKIAKPSENVKFLQNQAQLSNVKVGKVSSNLDKDKDKIIRTTSYFGKTIDLIKELIGDNYDAFVDNEELNVMRHDEVREGTITVINAETGLIETPRKQQYTLEVTMMLEPRLQVGQLAELQSITAPRFNGTYKIIGVNHDALISENESSENKTKVTLLYNAGGFRNI